MPPLGAGQQTREQELKAAFTRTRNLPSDAHKVYWVLLYKTASWVTATIPDERQPKSIGALAKRCGMSEPRLKRALKMLDDYGWIDRTYRPGRGRTTHYQLATGIDPPAKSGAMTTAERMRKYRARKKAAQISVTQAPGSRTGAVTMVTQNRVTRYDGERNETAGQEPVLTLGAARRAGGWGEEEIAEVSRMCLEALAPETGALTVTIAGRTEPARVCLGCGDLVPAVACFNGFHIMCEPAHLREGKIAA